MNEPNSLLLLAVLLAALSLAVGAILVQQRVRSLQESANARLLPLGLYWDSLRLFELPKDEAERRAFFSARGRESGLQSGLMSNGLTALLIVAVLLARWVCYPEKKKRCLRVLAEGEGLSAEDISHLAAGLR